MLRRTFLTGAAGAGLVPLATGVAHAASGPVHLVRSYVAGTGYGQAGKVAGQLQAGEALALRRVRDNRFDARTIDVYAGRVRLGSLPGIDSRILASMMDAGIAVSATVHSVRPDREKPRIEVDLALAGRPEVA